MNKDNSIKYIIPVVTYKNAYTGKFPFYKDNKKKCGIYRWNNLISGKCYVGSSINLTKRFYTYYSEKAMLNNLNTRTSNVYSALLKYGADKFSIDVLEYCKIDVIVEREQYYIDLLKPEYNILKVAYSRLDSKHSLKTRALMSIKQKERNNPIFGKILSETLKNI